MTWMKVEEMMKKLKGYHLLIAFLVFLFFMIFVLPHEAEKSAALGLTQSPDTSLFYTQEQLYQIAESYGKEGRTFYINQRFTFDLIWPLVYGIFLVIALAYLSQKVKKPIFKKTYILPVIAVIFDYLENTMTAIVMTRYPKETIILSHLAGFMTAFKWITLSLSFLLMMVLVIFVIHQRIKNSINLYEKLTYQVLKKENQIEIRRYDAFMMMKVKRTSNQGFGVLFQYISGYNSKRQKIQMTVPVLTDVESSNYIAFTMPKKHMSDYPDPLDSHIEMIEMPSKDYLSISFKGAHHQAKQAYESLNEYAKLHQIDLHGDPILLRYNGPFTPSFLKSNDVIVEIKNPY